MTANKPTEQYNSTNYGTIKPQATFPENKHEMSWLTNRIWLLETQEVACIELWLQNTGLHAVFYKEGIVFCIENHRP